MNQNKNTSMTLRSGKSIGGQVRSHSATCPLPSKPAIANNQAAENLADSTHSLVGETSMPKNPTGKRSLRRNKFLKVAGTKEAEQQVSPIFDPVAKNAAEIPMPMFDQKRLESKKINTEEPVEMLSRTESESRIPINDLSVRLPFDHSAERLRPRFDLNLPPPEESEE